jgi:hypothetical protein
VVRLPLIQGTLPALRYTVLGKLLERIETLKRKRSKSHNIQKREGKTFFASSYSFLEL